MDSPAPPNFGALLRQQRLLARLSQQALAERAGLGVDTIRALERGRRAVPRPDTVEMLAAALDLAPAARLAFAAAATGVAGDGVPAPAPAPIAPPDDDAPLAAVPPAPGGFALPVPPTPLIGREREEASIAHLLRGETARLVTLIGPGGVGKTHLALRVAAVVRDEYPDGVVFVDLSALRDPALVPSAIAQALGVREVGASAASERLRAFLRDRRALLVLDNCEQLLDAAPALATLLAGCPRLVLLATSRAPLRLRAEQQFRVAPLPLPDDGAIPSAEEAVGYGAVRLFVARARAVRPEFAFTDEHAAAVVRICRALDGLPLAIELAAARSAFLAPEALAGRLDHRLALLVDGARDLPARQRTLRAALDWSHDLLAPDEQAHFARLGVFAGGCTLASALAVAGADEAAVASLVEKSLLRLVAPRDGVGEPRVELLETIREYAREQLAARGEAASLARAHARHYLALAEEAEPHFREAAEAAWLARLDAEHDNLRAALAWSLADAAEADTGLRLAAALWHFWWARGHLTEGREWLDRLLAYAPASGPARTRALLGAGFLAMQQSDWGVARAHFEAGLALSRALGDVPLTAWLLRELGVLLAYFSEYAAARPLLEEALALSRSSGDRASQEASLLNLARLLRNQGAYAEARALLSEALRDAVAPGSAAALHLALGDLVRDDGDRAGAEREYAAGLAAARAVGHAGYTAWALGGLGQAALWRGDTARAVVLLSEALTLYRELGNAHSVGFVLHTLGLVARRAGDLARAEALLREALVQRRQLGGVGGTADTLEGLALVALDRGQAAQGVRYCGAIAAARDALGLAAPPVERVDVVAALRAARGALGEQAFAAAWAAGAALTLDEVARAHLAALPFPAEFAAPTPASERTPTRC